MNATPIRTAIRCHLPQVLKQTAFMLVETVDAPLPSPCPGVEASLDFGGPCNGTCWLAVDMVGAQQLAMDILGANCPTEGRCHEHVTAELLNILLSWILDAWWGEDVPRQIDTPRVASKPLNQTVAWSLPEETRVVVSTEDGYTLICGVTLAD